MPRRDHASFTPSHRMYGADGKFIALTMADSDGWHKTYETWAHGGRVFSPKNLEELGYRIEPIYTDEP